MRPPILLFCSFVLSVGISAQTNKGNVLVGGDISYTSERIGLGSDDKVKQFGLDANIGYFVIKKLALGIRTGYVNTSAKADNLNYHARSSALTIAPFVRYYILPVKNKVNVFTDAAWVKGREKWQQVGQPASASTVSFSGYDINAGPVFFINKHVALELSLGIRDRSHRQEPVFASSVGLQVHL